MNKRIRNVWLLAFFFLLSPIMFSSCSLLDMGYERHYKGEQKPLSEVAIIVQMATSTYNIINYIDGIETKKEKFPGTIVWAYTAGLIEIDPGKHTICTSYQKHSGSNQVQFSKKCANITLDAKPGHVYYFYPRLKTHESVWYPDYWDITEDLHTVELKEFAVKIDTALTKNKGSNTESILSLGTKQSKSPLVGFGEERKSSLKKWLNKNINVTYLFNRYVPYIIAEADDDIEYHLEIDQKTGNVLKVFEKKIKIVGGFAFQPLNSKFAYFTYPGSSRLTSLWQEQKDGSFIVVKQRFNARCAGNYYDYMLDTQLTDQLSREAINALVLAENTNKKVLRSDPAVQKRIRGKSDAEINQLLELEVLSMANEAKRLLVIAKNEATTELSRRNLSKIEKRIKNLIVTNVFGGYKPKVK